MYRLIEWFTRNDVAANLLLIFIVALGLYSVTNRTAVEVFPTIDLERVNISVSMRGATPSVMEDAITIRIEEAIQDLEGIEEIRSSSRENSVSVQVNVENGYDPRILMDDIKTRVDAINTFPDEAERPVISLAQRRREVISVAISGELSELELKQLTSRVERDLTNIPGVTQVDQEGGRPYEIAIEVKEQILREYDLEISDVVKAIQQSSIDLSAGSLKTEGGEILLSAKAQAYSGIDFAKIPLRALPDGSYLRIEDLAHIRDGFEETPLLTRFNGEPAMMLEVYRIGDQSAIEVANKVKGYVATQQEILPDTVSLTTWRDRSKVVKKRINTLVYNAIQGGILVMLMLTLFLRPYVAFWVLIGIPVSFCGALILLPLLGVSINIASLFGFILVLGIVVDDAIVTGENIYTRFSKGETPLDAAIKGTQEVSIPVTFGILTTIAAFLPLSFIEGTRGALFSNIPAVVIPVLLFSLIESKLVLPAHLKNMKHRNKVKPNVLTRWQMAVADGFEQAIIRYYKPLLNRALAHSGITLSVFIGVTILVIASVMAGHTRYIFFPRVQSETATATLSMPDGTPSELTTQHIDHMTAVAQSLQAKYIEPSTNTPIILNILSMVGSTGGSGAGQSNIGRVRFEIMPPESREFKITSSELVREWRKQIGVIPGAETLTYRSEIGRTSDPIDIQLKGDDYVVLKSLAEKIKARLAEFSDVFDITDSLASGKEEWRIKLKPQGVMLGLRLQAVTSQVRNAVFGAEAQRIQRGKDDIRVMVRYPVEQRNRSEVLKQLTIRGPDGQEIPFHEVAEIETTRSASTLYRIDRKRVLSVTADVNKATADMADIQIQMKAFIDELLLQQPGVLYSFEGENREQSDSFSSLIVGSFFVLMVIYTLLAIPFKSYYQPLIVMSVIPFGILGAIMGHWIMVMPLTVMSIMGILALTGVVVNDSLVLVDYINRRRKTGSSLQDAVREAGVARFRPVILTSLTTFAGLFPLLFEKSTQAQFLIPMAVSLGFGILFATLITLLVVPCNYLLVESLSGWLRGKPNDEQAQALQEG